MRKIILGLLTWAAIASANTCTEAWFTLLAYPYPSESSTSHLDSIYNSNHGDFIWTSRYIYKDAVPDRIITEFENDSRTAISLFCNTTDESVLTGKGTEILFSASTAEDTTTFIKKNYSNGKRGEDNVHKATKRYTSEMIKSDYENTFTEYRFMNDTLVGSTTYGYKSDSARTYTFYFVGDPADENKCFEYMADTVKSTITYTASDHGFSLRKEEGDSIREFFITKIEGTTSIRKHRAPVKISPKARYFDLLGRYKFTK